jgi:stearoyl-CoA desaturase (delta-9 desaturase)
MLVGMRPRQWVAVHRKHHAFTDTPRDPHSPVVLGYARVQFANALLYKKVARDPEQVARYARDLPADRWDRLL